MRVQRCSIALRFRGVAQVLLLTIVGGCGGGDGGGGESGTGTDSTLAACHDFCAKQATATDCPPSVATDPMCGDMCKVLVPSFSRECQPKAETYYRCGQTIAWECWPDLGLPQKKDSMACEAEGKAYRSACMGQ